MTYVKDVRKRPEKKIGKEMQSHLTKYSQTWGYCGKIVIRWAIWTRQ